MYTFKGNLTFKGLTETIGEKGFTKREFVVSPDPTAKYPNEVKFELLADNVNLIDDINIQDEVTVAFKLSGKRWNTKFYTSIVATNITKVKADSNNEDFPY